ncbi:aspartyl/asparaginyl beta-hydroxylase domain-containing protein [Shewanella rhizosphaerae]|uniref:aspartyl/asparaginyl beta-hydroxylase domain-containing protein n=1 Tax=Shewanella rhizosphaerae TaxID=2864207 RepID=UPI001C656159|nr:aspartyl/asparaginyl beta-hydroxylase domain-containing protein [Shewanella rhizosphaerae]QYK14060.1 aspartyl/asparaginyl beta-hydroxylase domain-containing protein [Shewanella rhizosphaerae]
MKLAKEFYRLPLSFDVERLQQELAAFDEDDWRAHHESFKGNSAIALISVGGSFNNEFKGPMSPTPALLQSPYLQQVIASFGEVIGRSRLMRLAPGCEVPLHSDINYHWHNRVRIHIPIVTDEAVQFHCDDKQVHMGEGECWIFDSWKYHKVVNKSDKMRVHLVIDTMGSSRFWQMVNEASLAYGNLDDPSFKPKHLNFIPEKPAEIITEKVNFPLVMPPSEVRLLTQELSAQIQSATGNGSEASQAFIKLLNDFALDWQALWSQFGDDKAGWDAFHRLRQQTLAQAAPLEQLVMVDSQTSAMKILVHLIMGPAMSPELAQVNIAAPQLTSTPSAPISSQTRPAPSSPVASTMKKQQPEPGLTRNSPCPCGSGKKYKQCHGQLN